MNPRELELLNAVVNRPDNWVSMLRKEPQIKIYRNYDFAYSESYYKKYRPTIEVDELTAEEFNRCNRLDVLANVLRDGAISLAGLPFMDSDELILRYYRMGRTLQFPITSTGRLCMSCNSLLTPDAKEISRYQWICAECYGKLNIKEPITGPFTVAELIDFLSQFDPDLPIAIEGECGPGYLHYQPREALLYNYGGGYNMEFIGYPLLESDAESIYDGLYPVVLI